MKFLLTVDSEPVLSAVLDTGISQNDEFDVGELQKCGFALEGREPGQEYQVCIGDILIDAQSMAMGKIIYWEDGFHFESAVGPVLAHLYSRQNTSDPWKLRSSLSVIVSPDKLGYARYLSMIEDLRLISEGLIFDLVSKSHRSLKLQSTGWGISFRAAHIELRVLELLWEELSTCLNDIQQDPVTTLKLVRERCESWGSERISPAGMRELAVAGIDPRRRQFQAPFSTIRERLRETHNTPEHQIIAGFLNFFRSRVTDCRIRAEATIEAIEDEKPYRNRKLSGNKNLKAKSDLTIYETHDVPRLRILSEACRRAMQLESQVSKAQYLPFLRDQPISLRPPNTPVFDHVRPYFYFRNAMVSYLQSSLIVLDAGLEERIKSTSRMYEQWVFLKIASALREAGLQCESYVGLLRRAGSFRFTFDFERNTTIVYRGKDNRIIRIRYEPYIYARREAVDRGDTVYRGISGDVPWTPDVLIEFCSPISSSDQPLTPEYVVVFDAKYTRNIEQYWEKTAKYRQIRAVHDNSTIVKQLWLVCPSPKEVECRDPAIEWGKNGPDRPKTEMIEGVLGLLPPESGDDDSEQELEATSHPQIDVFIQSLLAYLDILPLKNLNDKLL